MKTVLVGAGPIGCLLAVGLRERGIEVDVYERLPESPPCPAGEAALTLAAQELRHLLAAPLQQALLSLGTPIHQCIVHRDDGSLTSQPYGRGNDDYLLVVPRGRLTALLQEQARRAGARCFFEHDCVRLNVHKAEVELHRKGQRIKATGDLVLGCDGRNSVVRREMLRSGAPMDVTQRHVGHGYVDFCITSATAGRMALVEPGLHVWPRGALCLAVQPNADGTHTGRLTMPLRSDDRAQPAFEHVTTATELLALFERYFSDLLPCLAAVGDSILAAGPSELTTSLCSSFHHGRTVLFGDAAHDTLPTFGQSNNCSIEDVHEFLRLLDDRPLAPDGVADLLSAFSTRRAPRCGARMRQAQAYFAKRSPASSDQPGLAENPLAPAPAQPSVAVPLNLSLPQMAGLLDLAGESLLSYFRDLEQSVIPPSYVNVSLDVARYTGGTDACKALKELAVPTTTTPPKALLTELFDKVLTNGTVNAHGGFMAHVPSGGLFQSAVAEFIARSLNRFIGAWVATPGLVQIESNVIKWFCSILGYNDDAFGYLTTSGSLATWMGLHCARQQSGAAPDARYTVYVSDQAHFSVGKACMLLGLPRERVRIIDTDGTCAMNIASLVAALERDTLAGFTPMCIVATAGTTNTGAIDELPRLAQLCAQRGIWLHVDACLGGFFRLTQRGRAALAGIEEADSIAVDAHKSLFLPHGNSALLVKSRDSLKAAFQFSTGAYMTDFHPDPDMVDFCTFGPELSRDTRGLSAWFPIKMHGIAAFEDALDHVLDLAQYLEACLKDIEAIAVVRCHPMHLPIVTFKMRGATPGQEETLSQSLCERICEAQNAYVTTTEVPDHGLVVRACILNPRTSKALVDRLVTDITRVAQQLQGEWSARN